MAAKTNNNKTSTAVAARPWQQFALLLCVLAILASAIGVVYLAQHSRLLFTELESLRETQDQLDTEWSRLVLERSTLLSPAHVERVARRQLAMVQARPEDTVVVQP